jgi:hypothetical protein
MNIATERRAFLALVVFIASTAILWYLNPEKKIRENVNVGDKYLSIGMTFGYKPDDLYTMLDGFSEQNTKDERFYLIMDLFYPVLYGFSLAILLAYLQSKYPIASPGRFHYLWVLPLCAIVFDWGENISMIWIQSNYKKRTPGLMEVSDSLRRVTEFSRIMTMLKLLFIYASFFMAVFAVLFLIQSGWKALRPARAS